MLRASSGVSLTRQSLLVCGRVHPQAFTDAGFNHYDIYFDDCTVPDRALVDHWFDVCRKEKGAIAIHCKAGLGRTGTLICLWMMRKWKFTGRECIGYIRVIRPGSILGPQQQYLEEMQEEMWALGDPDIAPARGGRSVAAGGGRKLSAVEEAREREAARIRARENTDAMNRRAAQVVPCPAPACACAGGVCRHVFMSLCGHHVTLRPGASVRAVCGWSSRAAFACLRPAHRSTSWALAAEAPAGAETLAREGNQPGWKQIDSI